MSGLFYIQIIRGKFYYGLSQKNRIRLIVQEAPRGNIFDCKERALAESYLSFCVSIMPQELENKNKVFSFLAEILKIPKNEIAKIYERGYVAPFAPVVIKADISKEQALIIEEGEYNLAGLFVQAKPKRRYLYGQLLSHAMGYLREVDKERMNKLKSYGYRMKDVVGYAGVEALCERYLKAEKGGMQVEVNSRGHMMRLLGFRPPEKGKDVRLTIDLNMQHIAESGLADKKGAIIVMDPYSGAVMAIASSPGYDPNSFSQNKRQEISRLHQDSASPLFNRAISGLYPAASLFKLVVAIAGLENKKITPQTTFFCDGKIKVGDREFKCWDKHGTVDLYSALVHSCDVYFYHVGLSLGIHILSGYAAKFGLGALTGIDIGRNSDMEAVVEAAGLVPTASWKRRRKQEGWFSGDTVNLSIGQGDLLVTPIQMACLISSFANGGYSVRPYLIEEIDGNPNFAPARKNNPLPVERSYIELLNKALRGVVSHPEGTAHILDISGLTVSGKTGTAQVRRGASHGWFIGWAPADKPKIAFCVFVENAGSSAVACSIAKEMLEKFLEQKLI